MVQRIRAVSDARIAQTILAVSRKEISKAGAEISRVVWPRRICAGVISQGNFRALRELAWQVRPRVAYRRRFQASVAISANGFGPCALAAPIPRQPRASRVKIQLAFHTNDWRRVARPATA